MDGDLSSPSTTHGCCRCCCYGSRPPTNGGLYQSTQLGQHDVAHAHAHVADDQGSTRVHLQCEACMHSSQDARHGARNSGRYRARNEVAVTPLPSCWSACTKDLPEEPKQVQPNQENIAQVGGGADTALTVGATSSTSSSNSTRTGMGVSPVGSFLMLVSAHSCHRRAC